MKSTVAFSAFVALTCAGYANSVSAGSSLPAATGYVQCSTTGGDFDEPSSCSTSNEVAIRTLGLYATLSGSGSYPGGLVPLQGIIFAVTDFDFTVAGPDPYAKVEVDIGTRLHQSTVNGGYGFSEIVVNADADIFTGPNTAQKAICSDLSCTDQSTDFSGTLQVTTNPGYVSTVHMEIEAGGSYAAGANSGQAYADPYFYIDPSTLNAADYTITLSPGVGNGLPGVPEPAAWALMVIGIGTAGASLRNSRRRDAKAYIPVDVLPSL